MFRIFVNLFIFLSIFISLNAKEIRVGVFNHPPITYSQKDSKPNGIFVDILEDISKDKKWKPIYVHGSFKDHYQNLQDNKIDILVSFTPSKDREKEFSFNKIPVITTWAQIFTKDTLKIESILDLDGKRVAGMQKDIHFQKFLEETSKKQLTIEKVPTLSHKDAFEILLNNGADAVISEYFTSTLNNGKYGLNKAPFSFFPHPINFGTKKGENQDILDDIDKYLEKQKDDPNSNYNKFLTKNFSFNYLKDLPNQNKEKLTLTIKEKEFIKNNPKIRFKVSKNRPPFEFERDSKPAGIGVEYIKLIAQKIDLDVEFVLSDDSVKQSYDHMESKSGEYDTILFSVKNDQRAKRFSYGIPYLSYPMMLITNNQNKDISSIEDLFGRTIVLEENFLTNQWIKKDYPKINIINAKNTKEALKMVNNNKAIAYVGNLGIANYMKVFEGMDNLLVASSTKYGNVDFSFISPKEWPELSSILSKGFLEISPAEHIAVQQKWLTFQTIAKTDYSLIWRVIIVAGLIIFLSFWWNNKLRIEKNKTKKALEDLKASQEEIDKQQILILNQSKIASMGEMLENIAHQWRQPLSVISTAATGLQLKKENGILNDKEFNEFLVAINENAQHLSETIETFRNFIKSDEKPKKISLQDSILTSFHILNDLLKSNHIKLKDEIDYKNPIIIHSIHSEISQVIMNIINNSKDALVERKIQNAWIKLKLEKTKTSAILSIEDNGKGIDKDIGDLIYDPYFTTKHKSQGTGLGLHMSHRIVTESLKGKLYHKNTKNGAKFFIELALN